MTNTEETTLDKDFINKIKTELLKRKEQIINDLQDIEGKNHNKNASVKFPEYGYKPDENAQEIDEYTTNLAQDKVLNNTLRDIEGALQRIEDGTYGKCKYCHETISPKRLEARPVASACITCKTKLQNQL